MNQKEILKKSLNLPTTTFPLNNFNHLEREKEIREFWINKEIYEKKIRKNANKKSFVLHSGPTYANGKIHCGHVLNYVLKDIIVRYFSKNNFSPFVLGWDVHGLPVEHKVLQESKCQGAELRNLCKEFSEKQLAVQREQLKKLGLFTNYENYYSTAKKKYESEQLRAFGKFVKKGLVYKGLRPIHWSWSHETALAENEIEYFDKVDKSVFFKIPLSNSFKIFKKDIVYLLAWTTQPWTIPANRLIAIKGNSLYSMVKIKNDFLIILNSRINKLKDFFQDSIEITESFYGNKLEGEFYRNIYFENISCRVVCDDELVKENEGTGIVHIAPAFGSEDFALAQREKLEVECPMLPNGFFIKDKYGIFSDKHFSEVNELVLQDIKKKNILFKEEEVKHSYPHDWRDKNPLIYRLTEQWFIDLGKIKDEVIREIEKVSWNPEWTKEKMENSIRSRQDWCISRQRVWGLPIPVLYDEGRPILNEKIINFVADIFEERGSDCWFNGEILSLLKNNFSELFERNIILGKDIMDVWLDSGVSHWCVLEKNCF